jgi:hypothetical protein
MGWDGIGWIDLAQDRDQWEVLEWLHSWQLNSMNGTVLKKCI